VIPAKVSLEKREEERSFEWIDFLLIALIRFSHKLALKFKSLAGYSL